MNSSRKAGRLSAWLMLAVLLAWGPAASGALLDPTSWGSDVSPSSPATNADLSGVVGKYEVTNITGLGTTLTVVSYPAIDLFLKNVGQALEISMVPKDSESDRPIQKVWINDTSTLNIVTTPYFMHFNGGEATPVAFLPFDSKYDPTRIYEYSTPDVSVPTPDVLQDLKPRSLTGAGALVTNTYTIPSPVTAADTLFLTFLDVDDIVDVRSDPKVYPLAGTTFTNATTAAGIQALLDPISLDGVDLGAVLAGLKLSTTDKLGTVNLVGLSGALATAGFLVSQVVRTGETPRIELVPDVKQISIVNPSSITSRVAILATDEIKTLDEAKVTALKDTVAPKSTHVVESFKNAAGTVCVCALELLLDPSYGGISTLAATAQSAPKRMANTLSQVKVSPDPSLIPTYQLDLADFKLEGLAVKQLVAGTVDQVRVEHIEALHRGPVLISDPGGFMPRFNEDVFGYLHPDLKPAASLKDELSTSLASLRGNLSDFQFLACNLCIHPEDLAGFSSLLGQLEVFSLRGAVPTITPLPPDTFSTVVGSAGQLVSLLDQANLNKQNQDVYSVVKFRVSRDFFRTGIEGAKVTVNAILPGFKGNAIQTFTVETNGFGYAAVKMLPNIAYNFTVEKDGFITVNGAGASPGPGGTEGRDVRMKPTGGFEATVAKAGYSGLVLLLVLAVVLVSLWKNGSLPFGKRRRHGGGNGRRRGRRSR